MMIRTLTPAPTTASTLRPGAIRTDTALLLRAEGLVAFAAALGGYVNLTDNWLLLVATVLLPDLAMIGYAFGSRIGARAYNAAHTYTAPALLAVLALATSLPLLPLACV